MSKMSSMELNKSKIAAIVVTWNRKECLRECLQALFSQARQLDEIIVVDNASNDGTDRMILAEFAQVTYLRLPENTGGAGGFHEGVKKGYEKGYDWLWLMDDDVEPTENALLTMLRYSHVSKCIHPSKKYLDGEIFKWGYNFNLETGNKILLENASKNGEDYVRVNSGCFEGMLIHRDVVSNIGLPDKRFFVAGDDTVYGLLASLYTNNIYIKDILLIKKIKNDNIKNVLGRTSKRPSTLDIYYKMRNKFLIFEYLKKLGTFSRKAYLLFSLEIARRSAGIILYDRDIHRLFLLYKGVRDGLLRKF